MKTIAAIVISTFLLSVGYAEVTNSPTLQVRAIMKDIEAGKFRPIPGGPSDGWIMKTETGKEFQRSFLQFQSQPMIPVGAEAVPELIKWLEHDERHIRYIANYCLQQITGERPYLPYFATLPEQRSKGLLDDAVKVWSRWYADKGKRPNQSLERTAGKPAVAQF